MCQAKAAHYAGTPEAESYLAESKRYGMAADRIEELTRIIAGLRAEKTRYVPRGEPRPLRPGQGVPRDDIGNRISGPRDGQGKKRGKPRR